MNMGHNAKTYAAIIAVIIIVGILIVVAMLGTAPQSVVANTTSTTTIQAPTYVAPSLINQTQVQSAFGINGTYKVFSASNSVILNNVSALIVTNEAAFNSSSSGGMQFTEILVYPSNYSGSYNLSSSYARSTRNFRNYTSSLPSTVNVTVSTGQVSGMTYTLFDEQATSGALQLYLIGYKGTTSVSMDFTGFSTAVSSTTANTLISEIAQNA